METKTEKQKAPQLVRELEGKEIPSGKKGKFDSFYGILPTTRWDLRLKHALDRNLEWKSVTKIEPGDGRESSSIRLFGNAVRKGCTVSVFNMHLTETVIRFFSKPKGIILDPFAGGPERGVVSGIMGLHYIGIEIQHEQVEANLHYANQLKLSNVNWIVGDSCEIEKITENINLTKVDFIFTCPPFFNVEQYSKIPNDLSNSHSYPEFLEKFKRILKSSTSLLEENRFCVIVLSNFRDHGSKDDSLLPFESDTIRVLSDCGLRFYSEFVIINSHGNAPMRAETPLKNSRKLTTVGYKGLVFVKGCGKKAAEEFEKINPLGGSAIKPVAQMLREHQEGEANVVLPGNVHEMFSNYSELSCRAKRRRRKQFSKFKLRLNLENTLASAPESQH